MKNLVPLLLITFILFSCNKEDNKKNENLFIDLEVSNAQAIVVENLSGRRITEESLVDCDLLIDLKSVSQSFPDEVYLNGMPLIKTEITQANGRQSYVSDLQTYRTLDPVSIPAREIPNISGNPQLLPTDGIILTPDKWEVGCKFDVVLVGKKCNGETCPEKSLLGGRTWVCVCTWDCNFKWTSD